MIIYELGAFLRWAREERGITIGDFAEFCGIAKSTISKIEKGIHRPSKYTLEKLLQKLGYDFTNLGIHFVTQKDLRIQSLMDEIDSHLIRKKNEEAQKLLKELKESEGFERDKVNKQYYMFVEILLDKNKGVGNDIILERLKEAARFNIPSFNEKKIPDYFLSRQDLRIINMMAIIYHEEGELDKAIEIMFALKENFDNKSICKNHRGKHLPLIFYHLTKYLNMAGRHEEVIKLCDIGIKVCRDTGFLYQLPSITVNKADSLFQLGNKEESEKLFRWSYHALLLCGRDDWAEILKNHTQELGMAL